MSPMPVRPWAVGERVAVQLHKLAEPLDREAAVAARPGQLLTLEGIAAQLRVLATSDPLTPQSKED